MSAIFLSASIPQPGRGDFYKTADPFLIQMAVRELVSAVLGRRLLVWGGHPAITPMVWAVAQDLGVDYAQTVILYQSKFFKETFPDENRHFGNAVYVDAVYDDRVASLLKMREKMLSEHRYSAAVFIGGMEGIFDEHALFCKFNPGANILAIPGPGGAARDLAMKLGVTNTDELDQVDFTSLVYGRLNIRIDEPRKNTITHG